MKRAQIDAEAKRLLAKKVRWAHMGRTETGCDCIGMVILVGRKFAVPYIDMSDYPRLPDGRMVPYMAQFLVPAQGKPKVGQVAILRDDIYPCHCGIVVERHGALGLVHASAGKRKIVMDSLDGEFWNRLQGLFEYPGVED